MIRLGVMVLAFASLSLTTPSRGQPAPDTDAGRCATLLQAINGNGAPFKDPATLTASGPNTCTLGPVHIDAGPGVAIEIGSILIEGLTPVPGAPPPADGLVERKIALRDTKQVTVGGAPPPAWLQDVGQVPLLVVLASAQDVKAKTLTADLTISGVHYGAVGLTVSLSGLGSAPQPFGLPDVTPAEMTDLTLLWNSQRLLQRFAGPALSSTMGPDADAQVAAGKAQATQAMRDFLKQFPLVEDGTADALAGFVNDFPKPKKVLTVNIDMSAHPLSTKDTGVATGNPDDAMALAKQIKLGATYEGTAD